jgi:hypothetical protein
VGKEKKASMSWYPHLVLAPRKECPTLDRSPTPFVTVLVKCPQIVVRGPDT